MERRALGLVFKKTCMKYFYVVSYSKGVVSHSGGVEHLVLQRVFYVEKCGRCLFVW